MQLVIALAFTVTAFADTFSDAQKDYIYGDYQDSIDKLKRLSQTPQVTYLTGLNYLKIGDYDSARASFDRVIRAGSSQLYTVQAKIKSADTYFFEKNYSRAKKEFLELSSSGAGKNFLPLIYLRLAQIASKDGDWDERKTYLDRIKTQFPESAEMKYVGVLEGYGTYYTVQIGAFGTSDNAQSLKDDLASRNDVYIVKDMKGSLPVYKVRIGKFNNRNDAEKLCARLIEQGYPAIVYP